MTRLIRRLRRRDRSRGQSLVELALVLPVILLFLLIAIDFGRVYLGWINLNQMARIAANYASTNPDADFADPNGAYQTLVLRDARATNCDLLPAGSTDTVPAPVFASGQDLGDPASVSLTCRFGVITPIISFIVGNSIDVSSSSTFAIRTGAVNGIPTGGGGTSNVPVAAFSGSPLSGTAPLTVNFADMSSNAPLTWQWNFGDGNSSNTQSPVHSYTVPGTYTVSLTVTNPAGFDTETKSAYVVVDPPVTGGIDAEFSGTPISGPAPLTVAFTDATVGGIPLTYLWTFGDGQTSTQPNPAHVYASPGVYTVSLTVTDALGSNTETKTGYISVAVPTCVVPNVSDGSKKKVQATSELQALGFTVTQSGNNSNWTVRVQSPQGGLVVPCGSNVTIYQ